MRKLATAALSFSAALFISRYMLPYEWLLFLGAAAAALSPAGLFFRGYTRLRIITILLSLAAGFIWSFSYTAVFVAPSWELQDETAAVTAVVTDFPSARVRGFRVDCDIQQDRGRSIGARVYYYNDTDLKPGDVISFTARFRRTDVSDDGERFDALTSRGAFISAYVSGSIDITGTKTGLMHFPRRLSGLVADKIEEIFPDDVYPFMQALIAGHRAQLNQDTSLNSALSGAGIIHVVAISGMHVSFLMGFLGVLIKDRRLFAFIGIPVLVLFMAMTGFTPSVTRAGLMQIFLVSAPVFKRESDSITSLSAALLVLLAANPYAIASAGLQLSFAATLGIMLFTSKINYGIRDLLRGTKLLKSRLTKHIAVFAISGFSATIGALIFTLPLTAIHFGYISLLAPLTNLLTLWAVSIAFPLGIIAVISGFLHTYASIAFVYPVTFCIRYVIYAARFFAMIPYSTVYSSNAPVMFWLAYAYTMFIALPLLKARARQYIYPLCIVIALLCAILLITPLMPGESESFMTVLDVGQGLSVVLTSQQHTAIIDCGSSSGENAGAIAHEYLANRGRTAVDIVILTHFHADHVNGVEFLLSRVSVSALAIPDPDGSFLAEDIIDLARRQGTDIIYVTETLSIALGDMELILYPPMGDSDENERGLAVLTLGSLKTLITGDMGSGGERTLLRFAALPEIDVLVVGHHGSKHSTSEELLSAVSPKAAVISVGRNSYGHPAPEVLELLAQYGANVHRSDLKGHITIGR